MNNDRVTNNPMTDETSWPKFSRILRDLAMGPTLIVVARPAHNGLLDVLSDGAITYCRGAGTYFEVPLLVRP